jgi:hypothetical protein
VETAADLSAPLLGRGERHGDSNGDGAAENGAPAEDGLSVAAEQQVSLLLTASQAAVQAVASAPPCTGRHDTRQCAETPSFGYQQCCKPGSTCKLAEDSCEQHFQQRGALPVLCYREHKVHTGHNVLYAVYHTHFIMCIC